MIADAYLWVSGEGSIPKEIILATRIDRFGVKAILNRDFLYAYEVNRIELSEYIVKMYNARKNTKNAAEFAGENQYALELLSYAEKLVTND